jgi:hypothetical protein
VSSYHKSLLIGYIGALPVAVINFLVVNEEVTAKLAVPNKEPVNDVATTFSVVCNDPDT